MNKLPMICLFACLCTACGQSQQAHAPEGMVYFDGGSIMIGSERGLSNEAPIFEAQVEAFLLDESPVTVAEFRKFTEAAGYVTEAEKFGNSAVLNPQNGRWVLAEGASWKYPLGQDGPTAKDDHPVTQVSWNDANAYAEWAGRRLPAEVEWEYAAKNGKNSAQTYSWGNTLADSGVYKANVWQGQFPLKNTGEDGFLYTSPVGAFGKTEAGLTDMGGNVWEWTSDTYTLYKGNPDRFPADPNQKVIRGGSFLCDKEVCHGYRPPARQFNSRESATFHMGFRTAKDIE